MFSNITKIFVLSFALLIAGSSSIFSQIDSSAISILDRMSSVVTDLEQCSFTLNAQYDIYNSGLGLVKNSEVSKVYMKAPDKLLVNRSGDNGKKDLYYDGKKFTYYSADKNQYADTKAPQTIMEAIDSISAVYGVDFPAADIFYEDFVDDVMSKSDILVYLGLTDINGRECFHIAGRNSDLTYQIWILTDGTFLPGKIAINYVTEAGSPQYEAEFTEWNTNPDLQDSMFNFVVPTDARKIKISNKK
jgi:hypothetical protein